MPPCIVVPFDFSQAAERALRWAVDYKKTTGGTLIVVHVMTPSYMASEAGLPSVLPTEDDLDRVRQGLAEAVAGCDPSAMLEVREAPAIGPAIRELVTERHADLIVMGTHGRGGVSRAVLGSVADDLIRHANCPVVTIRAQTSQ